MIKQILKRKWLLCSIVLMSFTVPQERQIKIYMIGDSTMADKAKKAYPETGWGTPFANFFKPTAQVDNRAQNGRSTKSFLAENRWSSVRDSLREGDYVFIQFGHNDEVQTKKNATKEPEFKANLLRFVKETREKKANPILLTSIARRIFDPSGKLEDTHAVYSQIVRDVALESKTPLIDMDKKSQALLISFGPENSKLLYNHLAVGEHPNYPEGKEDNTHFNELGARKMAEMVLAEVRTLKLGLVDYVVNVNK